MVKGWKYLRRLNCASSCTTCCCVYDTLKDEQSQVIKLPNGDSIVLHGYERNYFGSFLLVVVSLLSFFVGLIFASTRPGGLTRWIYRRSALSRATKILLPSQTLVKIQHDADGRRWFVWRHHRFIWCSQSVKFKRVRCVDEIGLRFSDIHGLGNGLDSSNHQLRRDNYGRNTTDVSCPNLIYLFLAALIKPFRLFHAIAITVWILQSYYVYAALIGVAALIEMISSILFKYQHQKRLYRMSICKCEVTVLSPGHEKRHILSDDLVPGCVIELSHKDSMIMPCDAVILSGSCLAQESSGAKSMHKYQLPKSRTEVYNPENHRQHTLLRGSSVILNSSRVIALVIRTGWSTENGTILAAKLDNASRPSTFDQHNDRLFLCLGLIGLCTAVYGIYARSFTLDVFLLIPEGFHFIMICLPPLFSPALFFTSLYSVARLYYNGFRFNSFNEPHSILNHIGATDTVCLLENAVMQNADGKLVKVSSARYDEWIRDPQLTLCMAACINQHASHDLTMFSNSAWRVIAQENNHMVQSIANEHEVYRITKVYADEAHSWFPLVLVRADPIDSINATSWYFLRGSYSSVAELAEEFSFDEKDRHQSHTVAFAGRPLTEAEKFSTLDPDLSLLSRKFQLLGVASVELQVSKETSAIVSELRSADIHALLISSHGLEEAVYLARNAGIILNKEPVAQIEIPSMEALHPPSLSVIDLPETGSGVAMVGDGIQHHAHVVLTGSMLDALLQSFPEMVDQIIGRVTVFAAASPLQTNRFLEKLHSLGRTILVCKDGGDACPTVPLTYLTLAPYDERQVLHRDLCCDRSISSVGQLLGHCRASLVSSLGISKLMVCYAASRLTSTLLLYDNPPPAIQTLYVDLALMMAPTLLYGCTQARNQPLSTKMPARSIAHPKEILSVLVQLLLVIGGQCFALVMAQHQPWFETIASNSTEGPIISDENYAVYSLSLFQYLSLFVIFSSGTPHLRRIWSNLGLTLYLVTLTVFCCVMVLEPPEQLKMFMGLKTPPVFDFRLAVLSLAIIYIFSSLGVQYLIDYFTIFSCSSCRGSSRSSPDMGTPLQAVNVNVVYRPYTLTRQQQTASNDLLQPNTFNLPIF